MRIEAAGISSKKINLTSLKPLDLLKKLSRNLPTGLLLSFCDDLNLHISVGP